MNIPLTETSHIFSNTMKFNLLDSHPNQELLTCYDTITKQNYFTNKNDIIIQNEGLAMGAPSYGILSVTFLQNKEASHNKQNNVWSKTICIMLMISFSSLILTIQNIQAILTDFNLIYLNLHFTAESEQINIINYVDTSIQRTAHNKRITIYRKPTFTDTIIHYCFNYPTQHRYAAITYLNNRPHTYQLHT